MHNGYKAFHYMTIRVDCLEGKDEIVCCFGEVNADHGFKKIPRSEQSF